MAPNGLGMDTLFGVDYAEYHARLLRFLCKMGVPLEDARDLAQDTLLRAYESRDRYRPEYSLWVWLRAIARNLAIDYFRRVRVEQRLFVPLETLQHCGCEPNIDWERLDIERARLQVPEPYRTTLDLWCAGYEYAEIADLLGVRVGTVRSRLSRARRFLAQSTGLSG